MDAHEFIRSYPRNIKASSQNRYSGELAELMAPAINWSHQFGSYLYDHLAGKQPTADAEFLDNYQNWSANHLNHISSKVLAQPDEDGGLMASNELNFHWLNDAMLGIWQPIFFDQWLPQLGARRHQIRFAQDLLALQGIMQYQFRERVSGAREHYAYFSEEQLKFRQFFEGKLSEFDGAIIQLDVMAQKGHEKLSVVPAPLQFESCSHNHGQANVDFVWVHDDGDAIGVQMKNSVSEEQFARYDKERVVLVDGAMDLGNSLYRRTKAINSERLVGWAGLICAQHVLNISTNFKHFKRFRQIGFTPQEIITKKMAAQQYIKKQGLETSIAADRIKAARYLTGRLAGRLKDIRHES